MLIFTALSYKSQTPTLIGNYVYSTKGAGAAGVPAFNYDIPAGKNRVMIVAAYFERDHGAAKGSNYPGSNADNVPQLRIGTSNLTYHYYTYQYYGSDSGYPNTAYISSSLFSYVMRDSDNLPTGSTSFSFPAISSKPPYSSGDDVIISVAVFENAGQSTISSSLIGNGVVSPAYSSSFPAFSSTAPAAPVGTSQTNIVYLANGAITQESNVSNSAGWIDINSLSVNNPLGNNYSTFPSGGGYKPVNEADGVAMKTVYRTGVTGNPSINFSRTSSTQILSFLGRITPILPLARPAVSGTVYRDQNGNSIIDGDGTSSGVWNNGIPLYVNAIDTNGKVIATTAVNTSNGTFTFPVGGNLIEREIVKFQLSKNQGIVGQNAPIKELPNGWTTVGESIASGTSDGSADGEFTLTIGTASSPNFTTNRFGVATCSAGAFEPSINAATNYSTANSSYNIPCGATTANLSSLTASNKPTPSTVTLTWHTATPATTANKISNVTALTGTTKYYASFFDSVNNCYSPTKEVIVYAPICSANDNYAGTPITYGVGGTLPNIFANDTYNGTTVTLPLTNISFKEVVWVGMNAQVSVSNGTLYIPPTTQPGIYTYTYSITDLDADGVEDSNISYSTVTFRVVPDSDGDGINDDQDVDDDNDGILDTVECSNTVADLFAVFQANGFIDLVPSDFGLALNERNQNVSKDVSDKFGYPVNSGAVIVSILNASVHPTQDHWWTKNGEKPSIWNITGKLSAFVLLSQNNEYFGNDSKSIYGYTGPLIPITAPAGFVNQTAVAGQWGITETQTEKTLSCLNSTSALANWRYVDLNFGSKSFGFSTTTTVANPTYVVRMYLECDSDGDGIPDRLDLDSDADDCADAFEGAADVNLSQLVTAGSSLSGGSTSVDKNLCGGKTCVSTSGSNIGLPQLSTPLPSGYSNTTGQSVGDSKNGAVKGCYCVQPPSAGTPEPTKVGISVQQKQAGWPENIPNGHIVLESKQKGLVITRVPHVSFVPQTTDSIASPFAGMLVYDIKDSCVKLFNGINWNCIKRSCNDVSN